MRRGGQQHHVADFNHIFVSVEADELVFLGNFDPRSNRIVFQIAETAFQAVGEGIAHRDEFGIGIGRQCLGRRPGPAAAAPDQPNLEGVALGRVCPLGHAELRRHRAQGDRGAGLGGIACGRCRRLRGSCFQS